jgi:hypothetical protein
MSSNTHFYLYRSHIFFKLNRQSTLHKQNKLQTLDLQQLQREPMHADRQPHTCIIYREYIRSLQIKCKLINPICSIKFLNFPAPIALVRISQSRASSKSGLLNWPHARIYRLLSGPYLSISFFVQIDELS